MIRWDVAEQDKLVFFPTTRTLKGYPIIVRPREELAAWLEKEDNKILLVFVKWWSKKTLIWSDLLEGDINNHIYICQS